MSLSFQPVNPVMVHDPRVILENQRDYAILKCGSQTTWKQWTSTSVSTSSINFSVPPPSGGIIVDRKIYFYLPVRLMFYGNPPAGQRLINVKRDAPRAFPLASSLETIQTTINNQSMSFNCADVIQALLHFNTDEYLKNSDYSMTPNFQDQSQQYTDLYNSIKSPLATYGDNSDQSVQPRGGFPFTVVFNPISIGAPVSAIVDFAICEPIFMSPFYFGKSNGSGFYNCNSMDFTFNFVNNIANRMWSHDPILDIAGVQTPNPFTATTATFGNLATGQPFTTLPGGSQPLLLIQYITPQETQILSPQMSITYPYFDVQRYATDLNQSVGAGVNIPNFNSNNVQLSSIPRRLYIYVRQRNSDLYASASNTDTYFQINNINIQFLNKSGLLASASMMDLYKMARKNHCNMSWTQWSGGPVMNPASWLLPKISTMGSILCIEFASDIGLDSLDAPGKLSQCTLQVAVNCTNLSSSAISPSLYVVPVLEGTFTIQGLGSASTNIGVISSKDILDSHSKPWVSYADVEHVNGGDFWSGLKDFGQKISDFLKKHQVISKLASSPLGKIVDIATGLPISPTIAMAARKYGYGEGVYAGEDGGLLLGGKSLSKTALRKRLR